MNQPAISDPLLTRTQAAQFLDVSAEALAVWASTKRYKLPFIKIGRKVRYRQSHLDEFLRSRTVGAA
jgi:excisionase family DNA binding protein